MGQYIHIVAMSNDMTISPLLSSQTAPLELSPIDRLPKALLLNIFSSYLKEEDLQNLSRTRKSWKEELPSVTSLRSLQITVSIEQIMENANFTKHSLLKALKALFDAEAMGKTIDFKQAKIERKQIQACVLAALTFLDCKEICLLRKRIQLQEKSSYFMSMLTELALSKIVQNRLQTRFQKPIGQQIGMLLSNTGMLVKSGHFKAAKSIASLIPRINQKNSTLKQIKEIRKRPLSAIS